MSENIKKQARPKIPVEKQVCVFFRDGWLCRWCHRPTVFAPTLKYLEQYVERQGYQWRHAYFHPRWRRETAPMLDDLAAVIDHVKPVSKSGKNDEENLATACNKCNQRKSSGKPKPGKPVGGRHGEPKYWDGFVSLFLLLARQYEAELTPSEKEWYKALQEYLSSNPDWSREAQAQARL